MEGNDETKKLKTYMEVVKRTLRRNKYEDKMWIFEERSSKDKKSNEYY